MGEHRGQQTLFDRQTPETLADLVEAAVVESIESSTRLEGIVVSRPRIRDLVLKGTAPRSRSEKEVAGYRDALALIHEGHAGVRQRHAPVAHPPVPVPGATRR